MSLQIAWHPAALRVLLELPMHSAMIVDRAVIRFAETGAGQVEWEPPYYHLRAGLHVALFTVDRHVRQMTVLRIYRGT
jgi:hypothetical protein